MMESIKIALSLRLYISTVIQELTFSQTNSSTTESLLATLIMIFSMNGDLMRVSKNNHLHTVQLSTAR